MAWLSGPFAFCSVTELLPWPESGAAAARARRALIAARAGSQPGPTPTPSPARLHKQVRTIGAGIAGAREGRRAAARPIPAVSGQVRERARERHPAPATGGALGSLGAATLGARGSGRVRWGLRELEIREGRGRMRAGASGVAPDPRPVELARRCVPDSRLTPSCEGDFALFFCVPGLTL